MNRNFIALGLAAISFALVTGGFSHFAAAQETPKAKPDPKQTEQKKPVYSPYPDQKTSTVLPTGVLQQAPFAKARAACLKGRGYTVK